MNLETLVTQLGKDVKAGKGLKVVDFDGKCKVKEMN